MPSRNSIVPRAIRFIGLLLPQTVIPGVDGVPANNLGSVWDSGAGVLVTWQPFDFGLRAANVATATAAQEQAQAAANRTKFEVSVATADAFLTLIAAQQASEAARAAVASWQQLLKSTHALVSAQLRPGADESRIQAELAATEIQLARAEQAIGVARAALAQFLGRDAEQIAVNAGKLIDQLPPDTSEQPPNPTQNPLAIEQNAVVDHELSQLKALDRTYYPQLFVQGLGSARGTGMLTNGSRLGGLNGLAPTVQNYAVGLTVTFPVMDKFAIREQEIMQSASIRAAQAQYRLVTTNLQSQYAAALAELKGARRVAANTPVAASSAKTALEQASARYRSGLAPIDDVAQAQPLVVQGQIDNDLGRLSVWRALLRLFAARGDIQPFLAEAGN
jgi:outer membrane protein TolC